MIEIIKAVQQNEYFGVSENVEIAKGKYELDYSWSATKRKIKRQWALKGL